MKILSQSLLIGIVVLASAASTATGQTADAHKIVLPQEIKWGPAPASLPAGGGGELAQNRIGSYALIAKIVTHHGKHCILAVLK